MIYTVLPAWFHIVNFPELFVQSGLLALLAHCWVNHPHQKWFNWLFGAVTVLIVLLSLLGELYAFGILPSAG